MNTQTTATDWAALAEGSNFITKTLWAQFIRENVPAQPAKTVYLVNDTEGWFVHCPKSGDAEFGRVGFRRAAMLAQLLHTDAAVVLSS